MVFNSVLFAVFFAVVFAAYFALRRSVRGQNALLLVASGAFYAAWDWRFLGLIAVSVLIDYVAGVGLDARVDGRAGDDAPHARSPTARRALLVLSLVANLGVLGFFKYYGFFAESLNALLAALGLGTGLPLLDIVLPVGISFYTFQSMSYTIDVYRGRMRCEPSLSRFALFVAFFPQLVAGPIVRARDLIPQIARPRDVTRDDLESGAWLIFWGLFKKVFVADNLARLVEAGFTDQPANGGVALVAVYAFAMQIYCDFSGYTDIARGCGRVLGFDLPLNFRLPYFAKDPSDFWRRWHISLSTWLRDYLYVPLGGNRGTTAKTYRNLVLTMLLGGLWHGAAWTFVAWGAFHGLLLVVHRLWAGREGAPARAGAALWGKRLVFFHLVCAGWVLFRAVDMDQAWAVTSSVVLDFSTAGARFDSLLFYSAPVIAMQIGQHATDDLMFIRRVPWPLRAAAYVVLWFCMTLLGEFRGGEFIYFQF